MVGSWRAHASRWVGSASYVPKWLLLGTLVGLIAGFGAVVFFEALQLAGHLLLGAIAGYHPPTSLNEGGAFGSLRFSRPYAIPLVACGGALLGALLVFYFAPDAEGHGTDAAIHAVHHDPRGIRVRTVAVKLVASALTIGSGGSGGREGPTGQISAGFGSLLARVLDLEPADARIAVASGIGSGIGAIFAAPLGGAVLAAEIMYRDDFEAEALLPAFIASIVGYAVFGSIEGFAPIFGHAAAGYRLASASQLLWFAVVGVACGLVGLLYVKGFYGIGAAFARSVLPRWLRPALGGLLVGLIALAIPEVLGTGYGWIQQSLGPGLMQIPLWIVLVLPFARIVATGLSIGSGGSGGIFGPGMVIGAFVGAAVWRVLEPVVPGIGGDSAAFVIVGMTACFGSVSRAPLAMLLMVAEMTGTLNLFVPAMVAIGLATLIVLRSDETIYRSQLRNRAEAPAHRILAGLPLLAAIPVSQAMAEPRCVLEASLALDAAREKLAASGSRGAPVVDADGRYLGMLDARRLPSSARQPAVHTADLVDDSVAPLHSSDTLDIALEAIASRPSSWAPVLDGERRVVGTLATSDVVRGYRRALHGSLHLQSRRPHPRPWQPDGPGCSGSTRELLSARGQR